MSTGNIGGHWANKPRFTIQQIGTLAAMSGVAGVTAAVGSMPIGTTYNYSVMACLDGAGRLHNAASASLPVTNSTFGLGARVNLSWNAVVGARCYHVFRDVGAGLRLYGIAYTNSFVDRGAATGQMDGLVPAGLTADGFTYTIDMAPAYTGGPEPPWLQRSKAQILSLDYIDQSDPEEFQSVRRSLVTKEFGVRAKVEINFNVAPDSTEEDDLVAIYGAKLSFPDSATAIGARVFFNLTSNQGTSREVRVIGSFSRKPTQGKNILNSLTWSIVSVDVLPTVPVFGVADGSGLW